MTLTPKGTHSFAFDREMAIALMKWHIAVALLVICVIGRPSVADEQNDQNVLESQCKAQVARKCLEVPLVLWDNSISFVTVKLSGKPYLFMVDTGTAMICLDAQIAKELSRTPGIVQMDRQSNKYLRISEMRMGDLYLKNVPAYTYEMTSLFSSYDLPSQPKLAGLIGGSLLKSFAVTIDLEQRKMLLALSAKTLDPRSLVIPFELNGDRPVISVSVDGKARKKFIVDSGAYQIALIPKSWLKGRSVKRSGTHMWMDGGAHPAALLRLDLVLGNILRSQELCEIDLDEAAAPEDVTDAEIGNGLLNQFRTTVDYPRRRLILAPISSSAWMRFAQEGEMFRLHDQYQMAVKSFTSAILLNPRCPLLYLKRASVYKHSNQDVLALRDRKRARELATDRQP